MEHLAKALEVLLRIFSTVPPGRFRKDDSLSLAITSTVILFVIVVIVVLLFLFIAE